MIGREGSTGAEMPTDIVRGLTGSVKRLPCKLFYDDEGSRLFEAICEVDEYYVTRVERSILEQHAESIAACLGPHIRLVEFGSGNSSKTRTLLDHLDHPAAYVPIDISAGPLTAASLAITAAYPQVNVLPVCADYTHLIAIPQPNHAIARTVVFFPGSTIGNFPPDQAIHFLRRIARLCGPGGGVLIGVDQEKDAAILNAAYDDRAGVTALFNLNILHRINRDFGGDLPVRRFRHRAAYNARRRRIEMHVVAKGIVHGRVGETDIRVDDGEAITTEYSYKYHPSDFARLATHAGLHVQAMWTDPRRYFGVYYLTVDAETAALAA